MKNYSKKSGKYQYLTETLEVQNKKIRNQDSMVNEPIPRFKSVSNLPVLTN